MGRVTGRPAAEARVRSIVHGARVFDRWGARACAVMTAVRRSEAGLVPGKVAEYHDRDERSTDPIGRLTCKSDPDCLLVHGIPEIIIFR